MIETQRMTRPSQRAFRLAAWSVLLLVLFVGGAHAANIWLPRQELFVLKPDPPKEGQDVEVVYVGNSPDDVVYRVGDGVVQIPKIGRNGKFTIPRNLLDAGQDLILEDLSRGEEGITTRKVSQ